MPRWFSVGFLLQLLFFWCPVTAVEAQTGPVYPKAVSPRYAAEDPGKARMHTCLDQYNANKGTNANGGMPWI